MSNKKEKGIILNIPAKETTLSGWLVPTNPDRGSNGSGTEPG